MAKSIVASFSYPATKEKMDIVEKAEKRAREEGFHSFSEYVLFLLEQENSKKVEGLSNIACLQSLKPSLLDNYIMLSEDIKVFTDRLIKKVPEEDNREEVIKSIRIIVKLQDQLSKRYADLNRDKQFKDRMSQPSKVMIALQKEKGSANA